MKIYFLFGLLVLCHFSAKAQFTGGTHDGYDLAETTVTILPNHLSKVTSNSIKKALRNNTITAENPLIMLEDVQLIQRATLHNASGQLVWQIQPNNIVANLTLPSSLKAGIYYLTIFYPTAVIQTYRIQVIPDL